MKSESRAVLQLIGAELDGHRQVRVRIGGAVIAESVTTIGNKENDDDEREDKARPATRSRTRPSQRQGPARRSGSRTSRGQGPARRQSPGATSQIGSSNLRADREAQIVELMKAYPSARVIASDERGMWLRVESAVLEGIDRAATFLVAVSYSTGEFPRAWGFWEAHGGSEWIGPRHTNFPDGSVCAFVPGCGVWEPGHPLAGLLDFYSVWALRQLHLEEFGRWAGEQFSPHPFYSLVEFKSGELCSCNNDPPREYESCCKPTHLKHPLHILQADFERVMGVKLGDRKPPKYVTDFMAGIGSLPSTTQAFTIAAIINR